MFHFLCCFDARQEKLCIFGSNYCLVYFFLALNYRMRLRLCSTYVKGRLLNYNQILLVNVLLHTAVTLLYFSALLLFVKPRTVPRSKSVYAIVPPFLSCSQKQVLYIRIKSVFIISFIPVAGSYYLLK
jgi:hypothetical protein